MTDHTIHLGTGLAGTLLRQSVIARDTSQWDAAHGTARQLAASAISAPHPDDGLYRGAAAFAYALHASGPHPAYKTALQRLDEAIVKLVRTKLNAAHARISSAEPARIREYDVVSGLSGLGAYLLRRGTFPGLLEDVLRYIVRLLLTPVTVAGQPVPAWWTLDSPTGQPSPQQTDGHGNFGIAHGVAGPIALLALSARAGHTVPGQHDALHHACHLLEKWAAGPDRRNAWPETVTLDRWSSGLPHATPPGRPSWCYGLPGIARTLQLAALACHNDTARQRAEEALSACATDDRQLARLRDLTVCHGWTGTYLTLAAAAHDASTASTLPQHMPDLRARLNSALRQFPWPSSAGLLTGADGIRLALHTLDQPDRVTPTWGTCLLIT